MLTQGERTNGLRIDRRFPSSLSAPESSTVSNYEDFPKETEKKSRVKSRVTSKQTLNAGETVKVPFASHLKINNYKYNINNTLNWKFIE